MAEKFVSAFANGEGNKRRPTANERLNGFECGPADRELFNWLHHAVQAELGHLIDYAGLTDNDADLQQVRKAIEALIASATGTGATSDYILMNQARSRLLFYPEVLNSADGKINLTVPTGGQVRVVSGVSILHRGIHQMSTSDFDELSRTFSTAASKTYHVRMNMAPGAEALSINDLADAAYNPFSEPESHPSFDSTYDDMLIARVVTDASNVATITPLVNLHNIDTEADVHIGVQGLGELAFENHTNPANMGNYHTIELNWSRRPRPRLIAVNDFTTAHESDVTHPEYTIVDGGNGIENSFGLYAAHRYSVRIWDQRTIEVRNTRIRFGANA